jgi:hypothetical protein
MAMRSLRQRSSRHSCSSTLSTLCRIENLSKWYLSTSRPSTTLASSYAIISAGTTPAAETV